MADNGLTGFCLAFDVDIELSSLEPDFCGKGAMLDKSSGGDVTIDVGGRERLCVCRSRAKYCWVNGMVGADEVLFSCRNNGEVGCCRSGLAVFGNTGVLVKAYGATGAITLCPR